MHQSVKAKSHEDDDNDRAPVLFGPRVSRSDLYSSHTFKFSYFNLLLKLKSILLYFTLYPLEPHLQQKYKLLNLSPTYLTCLAWI